MVAINNKVVRARAFTCAGSDIAYEFGSRMGRVGCAVGAPELLSVCSIVRCEEDLPRKRNEFERARTVGHWSKVDLLKGWRRCAAHRNCRNEQQGKGKGQ